VYELGGVLGAGAYGVVRAAADRASGASWAVKSVPKRRAGLSPQLQLAYEAKIRSEVDTHSQLGASLDVLYLRDVFEDDSHVHLVLERASGGGVWPGGAFSEQAAAETLRAVLRAVAQTHAAGVVFRDVKPDNLLRTDGGALKLSDFGLAARCAPGQLLRERCGTPAYMSPEVVQQSYGFSCDLWSVGVCAYQLLTGRLPFRGEEEEGGPRPGQPGATKALFRSILFDSLDLQSEPWPAISPAAKDFVERLIGDKARDPGRRMGAAQALAHAWIRPQGLARPDGLDATVLARLQRFGVSGALQRALLRALASAATQPAAQQSNAELSSVARLFDSIAGGAADGIPAAGLAAALQARGYSASQAEWAQLLRVLDARGSGLVSRADFVAALADWRRVAEGEERWGAWAAEAFQALRASDGGGDGGERVSADALLHEACEVDWEAAGGAACRESVARALRGAAGAEGLSLADWARLLDEAASGEEELGEFDSRSAAAEQDSAFPA